MNELSFDIEDEYRPERIWWEISDHLAKITYHYAMLRQLLGKLDEKDLNIKKYKLRINIGQILGATQRADRYLDDILKPAIGDEKIELQRQWLHDAGGRNDPYE